MSNKLLFWIGMGFLLYILATESFDRQKSRQPGGTSSSGQQTGVTTKAQDTPSIIDNAITNIIQPAVEGKLPLTLGQNTRIGTPVEPQHIVDTKPGTGNTALCGSHVKARYVLGRKTLSSDGETVEFTVGQRSVIPGLEQAVRGMKVGGIRKAELPPALAYNNMALAKDPYAPQTLVPLEVELISSSPAISYDPYAIQVFEKTSGTGNGAVCFETIRVHYSTRTLEGKQLANTEAEGLPPLTFNIGSGTVPLGVEEALAGIRTGGIRTAILFPPVMKRLAAENPIMLSGEGHYPASPLIFEFKRIP